MQRLREVGLGQRRLELGGKQRLQAFPLRRALALEVERLGHAERLRRARLRLRVGGPRAFRGRVAGAQHGVELLHLRRLRIHSLQVLHKQRLTARRDVEVAVRAKLLGAQRRQTTAGSLRSRRGLLDAPLEDVLELRLLQRLPPEASEAQRGAARGAPREFLPPRLGPPRGEEVQVGVLQDGRAVEAPPKVAQRPHGHLKAGDLEVDDRADLVEHVGRLLRQEPVVRREGVHHQAVDGLAEAGGQRVEEPISPLAAQRERQLLPTR
mmetsp:Transcript_20430/g.57811  ORF Transcript_20430/g.57811 Transcript_20430/m.57811 type:complete len:266 (-) Transcript_20430:391-1188(-)